MKIRYITVTGADDSIKPEELIDLSRGWPNVEWAILVSKTSQGMRRFPSWDWINRLREIKNAGQQLAVDYPRFQFSCHICGRWAYNLVAGDMSFFEEKKDILDMFQRFQFNFHGHDLDHFSSNWVPNLKKVLPPNAQCIFQMDGVNNHLLDIALSHGLNAVPLFDLSSGAGIVPKDWPVPILNLFCGYAGGLGPQNIESELQRIESVVGKNVIWIDMETHVRSNNDVQFDLEKVRTCLKASQKYLEYRYSPE